MILRFLSFLRRDWNIEISYKFAFVFQFVGIVFQITLFYFLSKFVGNGAAKFLKNYGGNYFTFVLVGIAYQNYFSLALGGFSRNLRRDQMLGTLEMMLIAPVSGQQILGLSASFEMLFTSLRIFLYLLIGALFFGLDLHQANFLTCFVILFLTITSFSGIGIMSAAFIMIVKKGDPVVWLFSLGNTLFGGVYFTPDVLPPILQKVSFLLPMTHSLHAFRKGLLFGSPLTDLMPEILILTIFSIITLPLGFYSFKFAIRLAKKYGSLAQY